MGQIEIIEPEVAAALGGFATDFLLRDVEMPQQGPNVGALEVQMHYAWASYGPTIPLPLLHPAGGYYNPDFKNFATEDFRVLDRSI